jgi:riboflavin kinase/FMN adenylyltransferase
VITFRQNPLCTLKPDAFAGDIINLEQKLSFLEVLGVQLTVLIDFSPKFSKINGRDFIDLLLNRQMVKLIALGRNFRCGHQLDTGAEEIQNLAGARGVEVWVAPPVMDEGQPVSSSRIRQALAAGRRAEAERLLGRPLESINPDNIVPNRR